MPNNNIYDLSKLRKPSAPVGGLSGVAVQLVCTNCRLSLQPQAQAQIALAAFVDGKQIEVLRVEIDFACTGCGRRAWVQLPQDMPVGAASDRPKEEDSVMHGEEFIDA